MMNSRMETNIPIVENEARLRQVAGAIHEAVWLVDLRTQQILYVNPAFEAVCGCTPDDFCRGVVAFSQFIHPDDKDRVLSAGFNCSPTGSAEQRFRIIRTDGSIRWV